MIPDTAAIALDAGLATETETVTPGDLQVAFATLLRVRETITDLEARCLSAADIERANRMIQALESRLSDYETQCETLTENLREAERRCRVYKFRFEDAEAKLRSLQRTIAERLPEHGIEDDSFGVLPRDPLRPSAYSEPTTVRIVRAPEVQWDQP